LEASAECRASSKSVAKLAASRSKLSHLVSLYRSLHNYLRATMPGPACAMGMTNSSAMLTCGGRDATQAISSAMSSPVSG